MIENFIAERWDPNIPPDEKLLRALREVPRASFMHPALTHLAGQDRTAPIGYGQTISQPSLVAQMTEYMGLEGKESVLEVGTGSGYQAAILSRLAHRVFTIERIPELAARAERTIRELGYKNIVFSVGDGSLGLPDQAPFDAIMLTAAVPEIPMVLVNQLKDGGRIVAPVGKGRDVHMLTIGVKKGDTLGLDSRGFTQFVPLEGEFGWPIGTNKNRLQETFEAVAKSKGISVEEARQSIADQVGISSDELFGDK